MPFLSKMTDANEAWLLSFECGKKWFNTITAPRTKEMYSRDLKRYCDAVNKNPTEILALTVDGLRNVATEKEFQAEDLLDNYLYNTPDEEVTVHIKISTLCAVKSFYKANWRELNNNVGKNLSVPEPEKRTPKMQDIIEMEEAMAYQRDKAILWFLESTPVRHTTLVNLYWRDLKPTSEILNEIRNEAHGQGKRTVEEDEKLAKLVPYYIVLGAERLKGAGKGKYKGVKHIGFLHHYAVEKLEKYKLEIKKFNLEVTPDSPIFFALANNRFNKGKGDRLRGLSYIFSNACSMAWTDENKRFSPQDFRDFLQGALEKVEVNKNLISPLISHKVKGIDQHYSNHDIDEFLQVFVKALPLLVPQTVEEVKAESEAKFSKQEKSITQLEYENIDLKDKITHVRTEIKVHDVTHTQEITQLKEQISSMYKYVNKNLDPLLDVIDEIAKMPEGAEALRKYRAKMQAEMEG